MVWRNTGHASKTYCIAIYGSVAPAPEKGINTLYYDAVVGGPSDSTFVPFFYFKPFCLRFREKMERKVSRLSLIHI